SAVVVDPSGQTPHRPGRPGDWHSFLSNYTRIVCQTPRRFRYCVLRRWASILAEIEYLPALLLGLVPGSGGTLPVKGVGGGVEGVQNLNRPTSRRFSNPGRIGGFSH